jgi:hypothetical protein
MLARICSSAIDLKASGATKRYEMQQSMLSLSLSIFYRAVCFSVLLSLDHLQKKAAFKERWITSVLCRYTQGSRQGRRSNLSKLAGDASASNGNMKVLFDHEL